MRRVSLLVILMGFMLAWQGESFSDPIIKLAQVEDSSNTAGDGVIQPTEGARPRPRTLGVGVAVKY